MPTDVSVNWNHRLLEEFFAPGISAFASADLIDLTDRYPEAKHWIANHFLNSVFRGRFAPDSKALVVNVLFRARNAFTNYHTARELTLSYLGQVRPSNPSSGHYFDAIAVWESVLLNVQHAHDLLRPTGGDIFKSGDGSDDERLWLLANRVKHCGSDIARGVHTSEFTVPMWMTNEGLVSREARVKLSWQEVTAHVDALAAVANRLQDPATLAEQHGLKAP